MVTKWSPHHQQQQLRQFHGLGSGLRRRQKKMSAAEGRRTQETRAYREQGKNVFEAMWAGTTAPRSLSARSCAPLMPAEQQEQPPQTAFPPLQKWRRTHSCGARTRSGTARPPSGPPPRWPARAGPPRSWPREPPFKLLNFDFDFNPHPPPPRLNLQMTSTIFYSASLYIDKYCDSIYIPNIYSFIYTSQRSVYKYCQYFYYYS